MTLMKMAFQILQMNKMNHRIFSLIFFLLICSISCRRERSIDNARFSEKVKEEEKNDIKIYEEQKKNKALNLVGNNIVFYHLGEDDIKKFKDTSKIGYAIYEVDSDYGYNVNRLRGLLVNNKSLKDIPIIDTSVYLYKINNTVLDKRNFAHPYGLILTKFNGQPKIITGVNHSDFYYQEIEKYFLEK